MLAPMAAPSPPAPAALAHLRLATTCVLPQLAALQSLESLTLFRTEPCSADFALPRRLSLLTQLRVTRCGSPAEWWLSHIAACTGLRELLLDGNDLDKFAKVPALAQLTLLDLRRCHLSALPPTLSRLTALQALDVSLQQGDALLLTLTASLMGLARCRV